MVHLRGEVRLVLLFLQPGFSAFCVVPSDRFFQGHGFQPRRGCERWNLRRAATTLRLGPLGGGLPRVGATRPPWAWSLDIFRT